MFKRLEREAQRMRDKVVAIKERYDVHKERQAVKDMLDTATSKRAELHATDKIAEVIARAQAIQNRFIAQAANPIFAASINFIGATLAAQVAMQQAQDNIELNFAIIYRLRGEISDLPRDAAEGTDLKASAEAKLKEAQDAEVNFNAACATFTQQNTAAYTALISANVAVELALAQQAAVLAAAAAHHLAPADPAAVLAAAAGAALVPAFAAAQQREDAGPAAPVQRAHDDGFDLNGSDNDDSDAHQERPRPQAPQ